MRRHRDGSKLVCEHISTAVWQEVGVWLTRQGLHRALSNCFLRCCRTRTSSVRRTSSSLCTFPADLCIDRVDSVWRYSRSLCTIQTDLCIDRIDLSQVCENTVEEGQCLILLEIFWRLGDRVASSTHKAMLQYRYQIVQSPYSKVRIFVINKIFIFIIH